MFKNIIFAFFFLCLTNSCVVQQNEFLPLSWYAFTKANPQKQEAAKVYEFSDGMIRMYGENIGYLITEKSYKNFKLSMEFRWNIEEKYARNGVKKNSGVMYNIPIDAPDNIWPKGIQFQIKEKTTGDFIFLDKITAKVNDKLIEAGASVTSSKFTEKEKPYGEWNTILIISKAGNISQFLNGELVNQCTEASSTEGKISLNYEGAPIDFRNIQIRNSN